MGKLVEKSDRLLLLKKCGNERYYVFRPRLMRLFPKSGDMKEMNFKEISLEVINHQMLSIFII